MELTCTNVRYLLTIYHLSRVRLEVSSKDIACSLEVSRASVTSMMEVLVQKQLVIKERYGKVHLTRSGIRLAQVLAVQADELARELGRRMGLSGEEAWKAACAAVSQLPHRCFLSLPAGEPLPA
ncbi:metal-dependent transcriptional regulator [uncultured Flavonifractor sp.]|uniref:metal-dependent transcriptional regulator n=1 Tax=uncultured Flavonifractor sp. TaxID=1193534 RepID=UPI0026375E76|nr:DNA-binding protein [uncultured Flavonifractor sp.]